MSERGKTLLKGHTLRYEGKPVHRNGYRPQYSSGGHGECSCGELSGWLNSDAARKRWHREHKAAVSRVVPLVGVEEGAARG